MRAKAKWRASYSTPPRRFTVGTRTVLSAKVLDPMRTSSTNEMCGTTDVAAMENPLAGDPSLMLGEEVNLETVLAAWHTATLRLERTHETLCGEVSRLTKELEIKNRELARKNRLADLGQMASHVAHEVRNNLVPVSLYVSLLRRRVSEDSGSLNILAKIEAGFTALEATVSDLLSFTAHRQPQWQTFLVGDLVNEVCESLEPQLEAQMIDIDIDVPPNTLLSADRWKSNVSTPAAR